MSRGGRRLNTQAKKVSTTKCGKPLAKGSKQLHREAHLGSKSESCFSLASTSSLGEDASLDPTSSAYEPDSLDVSRI